jgi:hypothetical protein
VNTSGLRAGVETALGAGGTQTTGMLAKASRRRRLLRWVLKGEGELREKIDGDKPAHSWPGECARAWLSIAPHPHALSKTGPPTVNTR